MELCTNIKGDVLLEFIYMASEEAIEPEIYSRLVASRVVAGYGGNVLLVFDRSKQHWELPGGRIETGESPRDCAIRELVEESGQSVNVLDFVGLAKVHLKNGRIIFTAMYSACPPAIAPFQANEEIAMNSYWDFRSDIGYIDEIDRYLAALVINHGNSVKTPLP